MTSADTKWRMDGRNGSMAVPKRKKGRMKTHSRRSSHVLEAPAKSTCPQCHEVKLPHRVCPTCGFYKDREVIDTE